jgi:hypothetical protein
LCSNEDEVGCCVEAAAAADVDADDDVGDIIDAGGKRV